MKTTTVDHEILTRLGKAYTNFGRLPKHVWQNRQLTIHTKIRVYEACVLSVLLYDAETWATNQTQESKSSAPLKQSDEKQNFVKSHWLWSIFLLAEIL